MEELVISTKVLKTARMKDSVTLVSLLLLECIIRGFLFHASGPPRSRASFYVRLRTADFMFPAGEYHSGLRPLKE
ncbi:hypothetical protein NA56DRAFT_699437 [Hyaloscypha hepaticicola]|uniref:Uncharacterized protein n=1 Tax=Hyaloscypha hepaticicola TaxID=2082293 RepID=A0A2J6QGU9_9HELO|nr:hypothetical protein NA56DRAFT_699437 [Hyaloscypha hepaticicola]